MIFKATFNGIDITENLGSVAEDTCWGDDENYLAVVEATYEKHSDSNISKLKLIDTDSGIIHTIYKRKGKIVPTFASNSGDIKDKKNLGKYTMTE